MKLITARNSPFFPVVLFLLGKMLENVSFCIQEDSSSESAKTRLGNPPFTVCWGETQMENGNFVTKHGLHPSSPCASPQSEFKAERDNRQNHQLMLFVECHLSVTMFELECLFFFWSMKLFICIFFPFLCKYIYFDVK